MNRTRDRCACACGCGKKANAGYRFCKGHKSKKTLAARFWPKVAIGAPDECWPWKRGRTGNYGEIAVEVSANIYRPQRAHRVAWELTYGPIPRGPGYHGFEVCHTCDNPLCCNPHHLFLGTHQDNMNDMIAKGRARPGGPALAAGAVR